MSDASLPPTVKWVGGPDGHVALIDQTQLPAALVIHECRDVESIADAIRRLEVRGAPAIGIAAAMGLVLAAQGGETTEAVRRRVAGACDILRATRPTAVNLSRALDRMQQVSRDLRATDPMALRLALLSEARRIHEEDAASCRAIGMMGAPLVAEGAGVLTHCNAGVLATGGCGTALAPLYVAHEAGRSFRVYAGETRPLLQGARLTAWELHRAGIDVTLVCDSMAAVLMRDGRVDLVITGADRIAANGDVANKIGTYGLAQLASAHGIPFYVAAPVTTLDMNMADGAAIPIEMRDAEEIRAPWGRPVAPAGVWCWNPAFDVTPARLIRGLITDRGLVEPVTEDEIRRVVGVCGCPDT